MPGNDEKPEAIDALLATANLARALESEQFRRFLDQIPIAIVVSRMQDREYIAYANPEFEKLSGKTLADIQLKSWDILVWEAEGDSKTKLGEAIVSSVDATSSFRIERPDGQSVIIDLYSNVIVDDDDVPAFRLAALVDVSSHTLAAREELRQRLGEKDALLLEIQHRVKNNLQMIIALIRIEARNAQGRIDTAPFDRLAGRINSMQLLYKLLASPGQGNSVDLGVYLSEIASSVMQLHATEGIRLNLKVDTYPVSVNIAMPTGLVVNELLTNALKHAFVGRDGGAITLHSVVDEGACRIIIADDGVGLPEGVQWPEQGRLGALIVRSLRENAKADLMVESRPGQGMRVTITFTRTTSAPESVTA